MTTQERWEQLSFFEQMGNVASEISRARYWQEKGDGAQEEKTLLRAVDLIDMTISDGRWLTGCQEITRLREIVCDRFAGTHIYDVSLKNIETYLLPFALRARR